MAFKNTKKFSLFILWFYAYFPKANSLQCPLSDTFITSVRLYLNTQTVLYIKTEVSTMAYKAFRILILYCLSNLILYLSFPCSLCSNWTVISIASGTFHNGLTSVLASLLSSTGEILL